MASMWRQPGSDAAPLRQGVPDRWGRAAGPLPLVVPISTLLPGLLVGVGVSRWSHVSAGWYVRVAAGTIP